MIVEVIGGIILSTLEISNLGNVMSTNFLRVFFLFSAALFSMESFAERSGGLSGKSTEENLIAESDTAADSLAIASDKIRTRLKISRPALGIIDIRPSPIEGFYEVLMEIGKVFYFSENGHHFFTGDLYEVKLDGLANVSEDGRTRERKEIIDALDESEMLVFSPPKELVKATVTIFTDIDCIYCRKLHNEIPELNRLGIAVRYLAFPRSGVNTASYNKYVSAWCSDTPKIAFTKAKMGESIPTKSCKNPIAKQLMLASRVGVNSTPALVFEDGSLQPGYAPAKALAAKLGIL